MPAKWVDIGRRFIPGTAAALYMVELPGKGLDFVRPRPPAGPYVGDARAWLSKAVGHHVHEACRRLGQAF